jgi:hypothetical protein
MSTQRARVMTELEQLETTIATALRMPSVHSEFQSTCVTENSCVARVRFGRDYLPSADLTAIYVWPELPAVFLLREMRTEVAQVQLSTVMCGLSPPGVPTARLLSPKAHNVFCILPAAVRGSRPESTSGPETKETMRRLQPGIHCEAKRRQNLQPGLSSGRVPEKGLGQAQSDGGDPMRSLGPNPGQCPHAIQHE